MRFGWDRSTQSCQTTSRSLMSMGPRKCVNNLTELSHFKNSPARSMLLSFIVGISESLRKVRGADEPVYHDNEAIDHVSSFLSDIETQITSFNLSSSTKSRFGDKNFRSWLQMVKNAIPGLIDKLIPRESQTVKLDLQEYLSSSFGDSQRLDYGTGHELNFVAFLCCLELLDICKAHHRRKVVSHVFERYITISRKLQQYFRLEPAGSRGVWGLDDYCFIPFLWGAAQLRNESIPPTAILADSKNPFGGMFFDSCSYVKLIKPGPLAVVSPLLASLSTVRTWSKIEDGLLKMYCAECLDKFQVIQHFHFGTLLPFR